MLRRRGAAYNSGKEKSAEYLFNWISISIKGDAHLSLDSSPLTHKIGIYQWVLFWQIELSIKIKFVLSKVYQKNLNKQYESCDEWNFLLHVGNFK